MATMNNIDIRRVDLNLLIAFEAIYEEGSVTQASERLHLTQSALSHALSRLRELCDDPLFERRGNTMTPTMMARRLIRPVQAALSLVERAINQTRPEEAGKTRRKLVLGIAMASYGHSVISQLMARLPAAAPYEIAVTPYLPAKLESDLAAGKMDLALQFEFPHSAQIRSALLSREEMAILVRQGHPLAGRPMDMETYLRQYHVLVTPAERSANLLDMEFQRLGYERSIVLRCQDFWIACQTVAATDYLITAIRSTLEGMQKQVPGTEMLPLPEDLLTPQLTNIKLHWHDTADGDPDIRWLRETLLEICADRRPAGFPGDAGD